jgi:hypothetical protein
VDRAVGVGEFYGGRIAYYYLSRITFHGYDNCTEIIGSEGKTSINLVANANRVQLSNIAGIQQDTTPGWIERYADAFVTEVEAFVDVGFDRKGTTIVVVVGVAGEFGDGEED